MSDILSSELELEQEECDKRLSYFSAESDEYSVVLKNVESLHRVLRDDNKAKAEVDEIYARIEAEKIAAEREHLEQLAAAEAKKAEARARVACTLITAGAGITISLVAIYASQTNVIMRDALNIGQGILKKVF